MQPSCKKFNAMLSEKHLHSISNLNISNPNYKILRANRKTGQPPGDLNKELRIFAKNRMSSLSLFASVLTFTSPGIEIYVYIISVVGDLYQQILLTTNSTNSKRTLCSNIPSSRYLKFISKWRMCVSIKNRF